MAQSASAALHDEKARYSAVDSLFCKHSASSLKYFQNPFISNIYNKLIKDNNIDTTKAIRRSPIIHRGYYTRNVSFTNILKQFLNTIPLSNDTTDNKEFTSQIVYLGPGFDTISLIPFIESSNASKIKTFEIDYPEIIKKKIEFYSSDKEIMNILSNVSSSIVTNDNTNVNTNVNINTIMKSLSPNLTLIGHDLRDTTSIISLLEQSDFNCNLPTLILSECVLVYIEKEYILNLCHEFSKILLHNSIWVTYDMINPYDIYGKHMIKNLEAVGFAIPGIKDFPTLANQCLRFSESGIYILYI